MILLAAVAHAHHPTAVTQVDTKAATASQGDLVDGASISGSVGYQHAAYAGTKRGSKRWDSIGQVHTDVLTARLAVQLEGGTGIALTMPAGNVRLSSDEDTKQRLGLGDLDLTVAQRLGGLTGSISLGMPTGRYDTGAATLTATDVSTEDGAIELVTWDTRVNLGSGALTTRIGIDGRWQKGRFAFHGGTSAWTPLTETTDGILWGSALSATAGSTATVVPDRWTVGLGMDVSHRTHNKLDTINEETGVVTASALGARSGVGVSLRSAIDLGADTRCQVDVHVPLWQHVHGIQLTETLTAGAACTHALRL